MRFAVSSGGRSIGSPAVFSTPKDFRKALAIFKEAARKLAHGRKIKAAVGGVPGVLDGQKSKLVRAPNLPRWRGKPLKKELQKVFKAPVYLENDAALAGLGEAIYGAGRGFKIVAYLAVGTGVGGARIIGGKIDENAFGFEPGHQIICVERGRDLEDYIGGAALQKRLHKKPEEIKNERARDLLAWWLAHGLHNIAVFWSPDAVVLGGSVMSIIPLERVKFHLKKALSIFPKAPQIKKAKLGDKAGLYGALALLK